MAAVRVTAAISQAGTGARMNSSQQCSWCCDTKDTLVFFSYPSWKPLKMRIQHHLTSCPQDCAGNSEDKLLYIMQHTACSRQWRDRWLGFLVLKALSPLNLKCMLIFFRNPAHVLLNKWSKCVHRHLVRIQLFWPARSRSSQVCFQHLLIKLNVFIYSFIYVPCT